MRESQLSNKIIKLIKANGRFAYKTSDRFQIGVPDIYYTNGCWIETKINSSLRPEQKLWAIKLMQRGDKWHMIQYSDMFYCKALIGSELKTIYKRSDLAELVLCLLQNS